MSAEDDFRAEAKRFEEMARRARDLRPVLNVVAQDVRTFVDDRFESQTDPSGVPWEATKRSIEEPGSRILIDTARLRQSIEARPEGPTTLLVGTNVEYARYLQPRWRFLPFVSTGASFELDMSGPSGELWRSVGERVREYIETGRIT